jgi:GNAT superfamily N-acetyltransferase
MSEKYEIKLLNAAEAEAFKNMTYGRYKPFMAWMDNILGRLFPVGLYYEGRPAGLLLALHLSADTKADILSIFIEKELRGQKLAVKMMACLEDKCREAGIKTVSSFYFDNRPFTAIINNLFDRCGFAPAEPEVYFCKCDKNFTNMPLIEYTNLPAGFETFKWNDLNPALKEKLRLEWQNKEWFDERLSPFSGGETTVDELSIGLRRGGEIAGWTICNYHSEDTILYSSIFIMPELQGTTLGIALQILSIREHLLTDLASQYPFGLFQVRYDNPARLKVVRKKFAKYSVEEYNQVIRQKNLK